MNLVSFNGLTGSKFAQLNVPNKCNPIPVFGHQDPYEDLAAMPDHEIQDLFEKSPIAKVKNLLSEQYESPASFAFAGDNFGPVDPKFMIAALAALRIQHRTYQREAPMLDHATRVFQKTFAGNKQEPVIFFMTPTGTAGNRMGFMPFTNSFQSIIFADNAHGLTREAGAYHALNGASAVGLPAVNGKLTLEAVKQYFQSIDQTYPNVEKPSGISISQPTEDGTLYTDDEVKALADFAHANGLILQIDGARLFYAAAATGKSLKELTTDLGADVVFVGGSKGGMFAAESVVFTPNFFKNAKNYTSKDSPMELQRELRSYAKQYGLNMGQAAGAMAQFIFALTQNHAASLAQNAIQQAKRLEKALTGIPGISLYAPTETNAVLVTMPQDVAKMLSTKYHLMLFKNRQLPGQENSVVVRLMTTSSTTNAEIAQLKKVLSELFSERKKPA